jgi:anti-sigma factor RsiW
MNDTQLGNSLRSLPHATASPNFTSETLRKVRLAGAPAPRAGTAFIWRMAAGVAMAACLIAVVSLGSLQYAHKQNVAQLRAEQRQLQAELQAVKQVASEPEPAVVFENSQGTQVIVDLDSAVQPASYTFD